MSALHVVEDLVVEDLVNGQVPVVKITYRGTTNRNARGSSEDRRRRREWLVETYRADVDVIRITYTDGGFSLVYPTTIELAEIWAESADGQVVASAERVPACRCYRCGRLLTEDDVTVDRIIPGCKGGTYRRNNIRPACGKHNSETGGRLGNERKAAKRGRS